MRRRVFISGFMLVLECLVALSAATRSTPQHFNHYTVRDGLASNIVYDVTQDKFGFIWIASTGGTDRLDGMSVTHFTHNDNDPYSLPYDKGRLSRDKKGNIWTCSVKGLSFYDPASNHFIPVNFPVTGKEGRAIAGLGFGNDHTIWFGTEDGWIRKMDSGMRYVSKVFNVQGLSLKDIVVDSRDRVWLCTDNGLFKIESGKPVQKFMDTLKGASNNCFTIFEDSGHQLWICSWGDGLKSFDPDKQLFKSYHFNDSGKTFPRNYASSIIQPFKDDELWVSSVDPDIGIAIFNTKTRSFRYLNHIPENNTSIASNVGIGLYRDRSGNIWYATEEGLDKYDPMENRFPVIDLNSIAGMPKSMGVASLLKQGNELWIGSTGEGLYILDLPTEKLVKRIDLSAVSKRPEGNYINTIYPYGASLLCGCFRGAYRYDRNTAKITYLPFITDHPVNAFAEDNQGRVLIAHSRGVMVVSKTLDKALDSLQGPTSVWSMYKDAGGDIWMAMSSTIYRYSNGRFNKVNEEFFQQLGDCRAYDISGDNSGNIFLATSAGAAIYNSRDKTFVRFTKENGLLNNNCYKIAPDKKGNIWVVVEKGISCIELSTGKIKNYSDAEGLVSPTFENPGFQIDETGMIWLSRYISIYGFLPDSLPRNTAMAPVYITAIRRDDSLLSTGPVRSNQPIILTHDNRSISFEFGMLNFSNSKLNTYEYTVEGLEQGWLPAGYRQFVTYSGLPPGDYVFRVRAKNADGIYGANIAQASFSVVPPFWQTDWFRLVLFMAFIGILVYFLHMRDRAVKKKANIRHQITEAEVKALRAQMNPHFIFNCLNTIDSYVLQNKQPEASQLIQRFSKLTRRILEHTSQSYITIQQEIETLNIYLQIEQMRKGRSFDFIVDADPETLRYLIPPMLIQPFVENAVVHGMRGGLKNTGGYIQIKTVAENHSIKITVEDNGIGRLRAMEIKRSQPETYRSISMEVTLGRLEALHSHARHTEYITFTDLENGSGTRVEIFIPVKKSQNAESSHN
jgi:ligand-binding sensor domain-containing protein